MPEVDRGRPLAERIATAVKFVLVNVLAVGFAVLVAIHIPLAMSFSAIRMDTLTSDESDIPRFRPNLRDEPYTHSKPPGIANYYHQTLLSTNAEGFRDRDHTIEKPPETFRVAVVGDSFIFGLDLAQDETLPADLERALNEHSDGLRYETFNFGIPGMNIEGMGRLTQTFVLKYHPDLIAYSFICDDVSRTDVVTVSEWSKAVRTWFSGWPWLGEQLLKPAVILKMLRYEADFRALSTVPPLYRARLKEGLGYYADLADSGGHDVIVLDFCREFHIDQAFAEFNSSRQRPIRLVTDFPFELNQENRHPTASSNAGLASLLVPAIQDIARKRSVSPPVQRAGS
jgi:hypothetical protein